MNRAGATYSNRSQTVWPGRYTPTIHRKKSGKGAKGRAKISWVPVAMALSITMMVCVTVNYRAFSELSSETDLHESLNTQIDGVTSENLALQEEIHYLKSDPNMIEREAKKFGFVPRKEKVPVPVVK